MALIQFYGVLATTASVFLGILTAYLVTRLSDLKSERSQIKRQIESIDVELEALDESRSIRINSLEETEERWKIEEAQENVDKFIDHDVGSDWDPSPNNVELEDALNALAEHRVSGGELIRPHAEELERRWDDLVDELQPMKTGPLGAPVEVANIDSPEATVGNWIVDALWDIYEQEKYDREGSRVSELDLSIEQLSDRRGALVQQYESLDPKQLKDSIKATIVPIGLSVVLPLTVRILHEIGFTLPVPNWALIFEPIGVFAFWLIGFFWTLYFVWVRVTDTNDDLPESPLRDSSETSSQTESDSNEYEEDLEAETSTANN
ncbi:hypothetical protein [Halopelagius longus]|uniref:Uncharacterized protein n=1 Tax=Halopelagius longus TaxID=1236180 RepID=A0A1H1GUJ5_9EURY|nr:hypothetical protein [Halopelagius longus]RDI69554.1 hypothetical protein DWB78_18540 [Halopelagius longus]SDR16847.1 hypothetical protein SAMN05216278_3872 [Halopelagius longus]